MTDAQKAAEALNQARQSRVLLEDYPAGLLPADREAAFAVQDASTQLHGGIGGWKVAPINPGVEPNCASIGKYLVFSSPADLEMLSPHMGLEVEVLFRFARDLPGDQGTITPDHVRDAIGSAHIAFEAVGSRFANPKAMSPLASLADSSSSVAIVVGDEMSDWQSLDLETLPMEISVDGAVVGNSSGGPSLGRIIETLTWLANHAAGRCGGLKAGHVVLTGSRISPKRAALGNTITASALGRYEVTARIH